MKKKVITLLLAVLMLCGCVSCADQPETPVPQETENSSVVTEGPVSDFVLSGDTAYTVVLPVEDTYGETSWALSIQQALGGSTAMRTDRMITDEEKAAGHLIILGKNGFPESAKAAEMLERGKDYVIFTEGTNIVLYSANAMTLKAAVDDLLSAVKDADGKKVVSLPQKKYVYFDYPCDELTLGGAKLADYVLVIPEGSARDEAKAATINEWMLENVGTELPVRKASEAEAANEILIGATGRSADTYTAALEDNSYRIELNGTKVVLAYKGYARGVDTVFLDALAGEKVDTLSLSDTTDAYGVFREDNFAAVYVTKRGQRLSAELLDSVSPGVLALLSECMYFESELQKGIARGEQWVYSNSSTYVPQSGSFDSMVKSGKTGMNCAMPQGWALIDMGVTTNGKHLYGNSTGGLANKGTSGIGTRAAAACDLTSWDGTVQFSTLYRKGLVEAGDIFYAKGHTFIYMGDQLFMAAGHDGKWHTEESAYTEDSRKACFETWVCDMESNADYNYTVYWQMRFKADYVPEYYRNAAGELVKCPIWDESYALKEQAFVAKPGKLN